MTIPTWLSDATSEFGESCKAKLTGPGEAEAAIRAPIEHLLAAAGAALDLLVVPHDEVRDNDRGVRPDYAISVNGAITGYVEVKKPGANLDPEAMTGHNQRQWLRQRDLPNLVYTNGTEWRLYRDSEPIGDPINLAGGALRTAGKQLTAPPEFEHLLVDFLRWKPAPITSITALVRAIAPLTRLLRGEVLDQLSDERRALSHGANEWSQPFLGLAQDWRALLFPTADDSVFADGYAQTVTFALLLARTEGIDLTAYSLHDIGTELGTEHSLMGRALQLLTAAVAKEFSVTLDLLIRVVNAVNWDRVRKGRKALNSDQERKREHDTYLHLYEHFLDEYDSALRQKSGSYYTPRVVVEEMVRLVEECLATRLGKPRAFLDPSVVTVDPAMGTGTYLHTILERVAERITTTDGPGAVAGAVTKVVERLNGFELQMGPYAVAELRTSDLLHTHGAKPPKDGLHLFVTDTLDDPTSTETQIASGLQLISESRRKANAVKSRTNVTVVIGNPPYDDRAQGRGGWVENGSASDGSTADPILDAFRYPGNGKHERHLKSMYVYFWRWATWKVWEAPSPDPDADDAGVVCFITTAGYLRGPGFKGMRNYLRTHASEGWIIDLTPEGQTPEVPTRIFPNVRQPLAIGLFVRRPDTDPTVPAAIRYRTIHGQRAEKFAALKSVTLDDSEWSTARTDWTAPFTPASETAWDEYPALNDLMPWAGPGIKASRTWIFAPATSILDQRWHEVVGEGDPTRKAELFKESPGVTLQRASEPLAGVTGINTHTPFAAESGPPPTPLRVGYRSFDRQWVLPDARLMQRAGPLWAARVPDQIFVIEQHSKPITSGPALVFTALIPDLDHFKGSEGGRALPRLHPDGSANLARGLIDALQTALAMPVTAADVLAYVAAVVSHPGFTRHYVDELTTPGVRVPVTADHEMFRAAIKVGQEVLWLHTYGEVMFSLDRPEGNVRFPTGDIRQPLALTPITALPSSISYDQTAHTVTLGDGTFGPVSPEVWNYDVGGKNVLKSWFNYRKSTPGGKKTSPLDLVHVLDWDADWTTEFIDLLTVLTRLVLLEPEQTTLLERIVAGPILSRDALGGLGVNWPYVAKDRKPRHSVSLDF